MDPQLYRDFGAHEDDHWWFAARRAIVRDFLEARLPPAAHRRILDVGCGTGGMLPLLAAFGEVSGLDASDEALAFAKTRAGGARLLKGVLPAGLPPSERFDLVTAFDVIEHIPEVIEALVNLRAALAPGGRLVVTVPAFMFLWSEHDVLNHHQRRYTEALLREQFQAAGLVMERSSYFNTWLFPPIAAVRLAQKLLPPRPGASDFSLLPKVVNTALAVLFSSERFAVSRARLPVGVSIIAMAHAA